MSTATPSALRIRLLGDLSLQLGDATLPPVGSARARSLLAFLVLHRDAPQPRDRLAFVLWPDSTEAQARTNLRHVLHDLRRALPNADAVLDVRPLTLQWRVDAHCSVDVAEYERALARGQRDDDEGLVALREAVDAYRGDLLEASYDEWLVSERERFRQRQISALERLVVMLETRREHGEAIARAEALVRLDPLRESTYRTLMGLYSARGDQARAVRAYHACVEMLQRELGAAPSRPTRELYERLLTPAEAPTATRDIHSAPLVGRVHEWARLTDCWLTAEREGARLVLVSGEPGIGKTRLVEELRAWCERRGIATAWARSYAAEGALAYAPVAAWLRDESVQTRLRHLDSVHRADVARLLPELEAQASTQPPSDETPSAEGRQRLFDALAAGLFTVNGPLLLVLDDVQWTDRETLHFVHYLLRVSPRAPLLIATTARREDLDDSNPATQLLTSLRALDRVTEIELGRLGRDDTAALSERLTHAALPPTDVDRLFAGTEGNPLFVIETLRAGWENGRLAERPLAARVQAVIEARLAQLTPHARDIAGVAAAIGREFTAELLARTLVLDEETLIRALDELWRRRVVREVGVDAYDFSHDRIREVAYRALGPARRRSTHRLVADALEDLHAHDPSVSAQVAAHRDHAGDGQNAIRWYERAAEVAVARYANGEAVRLLGRALEIVRGGPAGAERDADERSLVVRFVTPLAAVEGFSSSRLRDAQQRAIVLGRTLGIAPEPALLRSLALANIVAGDFTAAHAHTTRLRMQGAEFSDDTALVESDYMLGIAAFWQGELAAARAHFESVVARYRDEHRATHLLRYGLDPKVVCLSRLGNTLAFLGHVDEALRASDEALAIAASMDHPQSLSTALIFASLLALELRNHDRLRGHVAALAAEHARDDAPQVRVGAEAFAGFLDALDGRAAGIERVRAVTDEMLAAPAAPGAAAMAARVLLEACLVRRDARSGLEAVERMRRAPSGSALWAAETERLQAEFLAARQASPADVRRSLERALDLARAQGAGLFERRAVESLRRLQQRR